MGFGLKVIYNHIKVKANELIYGLGDVFPGRRSDVRRTLSETFARRDRIFFRKKKVQAKDYPFVVHDPYEIFGPDVKFGDFSLVGDNWINGTGKPVALLWGFNNWKWGFVAEYLSEYRVGFAPRKMSTITSLLSTRRFPLPVQCFIFWGFTETKGVRNFAQKRKIPILRMEDGFLRSSTLGASHSTPYSLVLDATGLHYDPSAPSDLENILNTHQFSALQLAEATRCMALMRSLSLSKYNPPAVNKAGGRALALRRRVAVVGQVDNDMAMRLGNPDRWTMIELIRLAKFENPDADIVYRPHPDVYQGFQRSRFRSRPVAMICEIQSPDVPMADFLEGIDHVYTVTSLAGLEALLRGKKVTVVGAAFYAGWGLTDDRILFPRRQAKRTVEELFHAVYLTYPRYLASIDCADIAFHATCLRIKADMSVVGFDDAKKTDATKLEDALKLARTDFWPSILFRADAVPLDSVLSAIDFSSFLAHNTGRIYQKLFVHLILGKLCSLAGRDAFLTQVRKFIDVDVLGEVLLKLRRYSPGTYVTRHMAWLLAETREDAIAHEVLVTRIQKYVEFQNRTLTSDAVTADGGEGSPTLMEPAEYVSDEQRVLLQEMLDLHIGNKEFVKAVDVICLLAVTGHGTMSIALKAARIATAIFDVHSARDIAIFCQKGDLYAENRRALSLFLGNLPTDPTAYPSLQLQQDLALELKLNPERINNCLTLSRQFMEDRARIDQVVVSWLGMDNEQTIQKAMAYLEVGQPARARSIVESVLRSEGESDRIRVAYAKVLVACGQHEGALKVLAVARNLQPTEANYKESLRLMSFLGHFSEAKVLIKDAQLKRIDVGEAFIMPSHLGLKEIEAGYKCYLNVPFREQVIKYYGEKYYSEESIENIDDGLLIMAVYGPGDEVRFASLYEDFIREFGAGKFRLTCDYRFESLFSRSFPDISFIPVRRSRGFSQSYPREIYNNLPGAELCVMLDNETVTPIENASSIVMVTDLIWQFRKTYDCFPGRPYLKCDEALVDVYRTRLAGGPVYVGLCWRSSLATYARSIHYLTVEEIAPIFSIPNIVYVNMQYDDCAEELAWVEERFPGKIVDFSDIDQYNDFDAVAALMKCVDLVVSPATSVVELAGAVGCEAWLLSNSAELHWRKLDDQGSDVWHNTTRHVEGSVLGDKNTLVDNLRNQLMMFSENRARVCVDVADGPMQFQ